MSEVVNLAEFLTNEGFDTPPAASRAREVLEQAGLTRPGKVAIATEKLDQARAALGGLTLVCEHATCRDIASRQRRGELVTVSEAACSVCGGSDIAREVTAMSQAMRRHNLERLLVLGGTPSQHQQLQSLLAGQAVEIRFIDGTAGAHNTTDARHNLNWAQLVVIWASTPLPHKVSQVYTNRQNRRLRPQITVARRSPTALCQGVVAHLAGTAG